MSDPISGIHSALPVVAPVLAQPPVHHAHQPPSEMPHDVVTLSQSEQVSRMSELGESPSIIAQSLEIPIATVNRDLGIAATQMVSKPAAPHVTLDQSA